MNSKKVSLINEFMKLSKDKKSEDMLPLLLAFSGKVKKEGITFSKDEIIELTENLTKDLPDDKKAQAQMLIKMMM